MKRILLLITFLIISSFRVFAQTKEETVQWIKDKVNQYGNQKLSFSDTPFQNFVEIRKAHDSDSIIISRSYCAGGALIRYNNGPWQCEHSILSQIYLDRITSVKVNPDSENGKKWPSLSLYGSGLFNPDNGCFYLFISWDSEPDLLNRMYKAFQKLVAFNNQNKPKETF